MEARKGREAAMAALEAEFGPRTGMIKNIDPSVTASHRSIRRIRVVEHLRAKSMGLIG